MVQTRIGKSLSTQKQQRHESFLCHKELLKYSYLPEGVIELIQNVFFIKNLALVAVLIVIMDLLAHFSR